MGIQLEQATHETNKTNPNDQTNKQASAKNRNTLFQTSLINIVGSKTLSNVVITYLPFPFKNIFIVVFRFSSEFSNESVVWFTGVFS